MAESKRWLYTCQADRSIFSDAGEHFLQVCSVNEQFEKFRRKVSEKVRTNDRK